jgi:hypothetical protein
MAGFRFSMSWEAVAIPADATDHVIATLATPSNQAALMSSLFLGLQGTSVTDKAIIFRVQYAFTAGTPAGTIIAANLTPFSGVNSNMITKTGPFSVEPNLSGPILWEDTIQGELSGGFTSPLTDRLGFEPGAIIAVVANNSSANANLCTGSLNWEE